MGSDRMFQTALWGVDEDEVLEYMDRLLAVIEHQQTSREGNREFLIRQPRKDLSAEFQRHRTKRKRRYVLMAVCPLLCIVLVTAFCWFRIGVAGVTGDSMSPALKPGDLVIYSRESGDKPQIFYLYFTRLLRNETCAQKSTFLSTFPFIFLYLSAFLICTSHCDRDLL